MTLTDIIILFIVIIVIGLVSYFAFWRNRKKPCHGCPYAKNCQSKTCTKVNKK